MQKIFSTEQIRRADAYTIQHEPISSIDLMERAATACVDWIKNSLDVQQQKFVILCGPGNNGGDGLAIARLLHESRVQVVVFIQNDDSKKSEDCAINLKRATECGVDIHSESEIESFLYSKDSILIDALFGSGLSKPMEGRFKELVDWINKSSCQVISIDIPSGLFADNAVSQSKDSIVRANHTLSFEFQKLAFMFPENEAFVGQMHLLPIGIHPKFIEEEPSNHSIFQAADAKALLKPRMRFSHKGTFGHALLIGGSYGKMGAAVLMAKACQRAGVGLVTSHIPSCGYNIMQSTVPEAMISVDANEKFCSQLSYLDAYTAVAIGPGLGMDKASANLLKLLIQEAKVPLVLDADAINILAENPTWMAFLPKGTILTPHPKEFARLTGKTSNSFDAMDNLRSFCMRNSLNMVLKGAYSIVCSPDGKCSFNQTGNPGMATGGSGDVLTGIIAGLLAQGYSATNANLLGVYLHGRAGDIAVADTGFEALVASDIFNSLGKAFIELYE